jgi:broad specificity phosphatase PhoE
MLTDIYILRHCQSEFNANHNSETRDCLLTVMGVKQALDLSHPVVFDVVYVSPLSRSKQTLELSGINYRDVVICHLLREIKIDWCDFFNDEDIHLESDDDFRDRLVEFKSWFQKELCFRYPRNVLLVGHADFFHHMTEKYIPDTMANGVILHWKNIDYL